MPTSRVRASTFTGSAFTSPNLAVDAGTGTFSTWVNATRRGTTTGTFGGFDFSAIPSGSTINSVTALLRHYEVASANIGSITVDVVAVAASGAAVEHVVSLPAVLPDSVDVVWTRANNTTSTTCYVDYLDVVVDYTEPPKSGAFNGTDYTVPEVWNGTRWVVPEVWNGTRWVPLGGG